MKLLLIGFAATLLAGCQTTKPMLQTECITVGTESGDVIKVCPLPAGILCFEKDGQFDCLQMQDPILRADKGQ
jgi:hypothetical protein